MMQMLCFLTSKVRKLRSGWGSAPDPYGGAYSAPQYPLAVSFHPLAGPILKSFRQPYTVLIIGLGVCTKSAIAINPKFQ